MNMTPLEFFLQFMSPYWNAIGLASGVIGVPLAIYLFVISKRKHILCYSYSSRSVVSATSKYASDLKMEFRGRKIERLTRTNIFLWNGGRTAIRSTDFPSTDPLRFQWPMSSEDVVDVSLIYSSRPECNVIVSSSWEDGDCGVTFEFLNPGQGGVLQVLHNSTPTTTLRLQGTILDGVVTSKGSNNILRSDFFERLFLSPMHIRGTKRIENEEIDETRRKLLYWFPLAVGGMLLAAMFFVAVVPDTLLPFQNSVQLTEHPSPLKTRLIIMFGLFIYSLPFLLMAKRTLPREFERFR